MGAASNKLRIAWFSPLHTKGQGSESVSAYCSDELLPLLRERFDIELFHNGFDRYRDFPTFHYLSAFVHHRERPYDLFFYQLEDRRASNFIRVHLGLMPGMVWFHDFIFTSFGPEPILNSPWNCAVRKFNGESLPWPKRGEELEQQGPLGYREGAWALAPLFSNPVAHAEYRRNIQTRLDAKAGDLSAFVPMPVSSRPVEHRRAETLRVSFGGSPRIEHRAHKILQALSEAAVPYRLQWLLSAAEEAPARELLREFEIEACDLIIGRSPARWNALLQETDFALHPLFSVYGQADPYLGQSLMQGVPALVTRFGSTEYLPENLVFKIDPGSQEVFQIAEVMRALHARRVPDVRERTRRFALDFYAADHVAAELAHAFERAAPNIGRFSERWSAFESAARASLLAEVPLLLPQSSDWELLLKPSFKELGWL